MAGVIHLASSPSTSSGSTSVPSKPDFRELGISGTKIFAGIVTEETVPQLQGWNAYRTYQGMRFDATGSALYKSIELPIRSARWFVNPANDSPEAVKYADFCHDNLYNFGSQSMDDVLRLSLLCLPFGFSWNELIYSQFEEGPWKGLVGWDNIAYRSPATKWRWNHGYVNNRRQLVSVTQLAPPFYEQTDIPRNKLLLFVNDLEGSNYDGFSLFRPAWKDYFFRDALVRIRAIGLERGYMGIPRATLPQGYGDDLRDLAKQIVETLRVDEQAGVIHPEELGVDVMFNKLDGAPMDNAIHYHNTQILLSQLAQFLLLGSKSVGSYALSSDQSELFQQAINAKANYVAEVFNLDPGFPTLCRFNFPGLKQEDLPKLQHGDIGQRALERLGRTLQALGQWGFLTPDDPTEDRIRQMLDLPQRENTVDDRALLDLVQETFPIEPQYGIMHPDTRLPSPLATAAKTAAARAATPKATAPPAKPATGAGSDKQRAQSQADANMAEYRARYIDNMARVTELQARRPFPRPRGRPTERERRAVLATERFTEALEDAFNSTGQIPERPSVHVARHRQPYRVRLAEPDTVTAKTAAIASNHQISLTNIMRPKARR